MKTETRKMTEFEKEVREKLKNEKRQKMSEAFQDAWSLQMHNDAVQPIKPINEFIGICFVVEVTTEVIKETTKVVIPPAARLAIDGVMHLAPRVTYSIRKSLEAGKKFDESNPLRA